MSDAPQKLRFAFTPSWRGVVLFAVAFFAAVPKLAEALFLQGYSQGFRGGVLLGVSFALLMVAAGPSSARLVIEEERILFAPHGFLGRSEEWECSRVSEAQIVLFRASAAFIIRLTDGSERRIAAWSRWGVLSRATARKAKRAIAAIETAMRSQTNRAPKPA